MPNKTESIVLGSMVSAGVVSFIANFGTGKEKALVESKIVIGDTLATAGLLLLAGISPEIAAPLSVLVLVSALNNHGVAFFKTVNKILGGISTTPVSSVTGSSRVGDLFASGIGGLGSSIVDAIKGKSFDAGGVSPVFKAKLDALIAASPGTITINNSYRSEAEQTILWDNAVSKYGSADAAAQWVARPASRGGTDSNHTKGIAADLEFADTNAQDWAHNNAGRFGLKFPMSWEPWHIELA